MSVTVLINITAQADSTEDAQALVDALNLPPGANLLVTVSEHLVSGTVNDEGTIVTSEMAMAEQQAQAEGNGPVEMDAPAE